MSSSVSDISIPDIPPLSPGSSVSTRFQDEYDELLKFAVVVPKYDPHHLPSTLTDARDSFMQTGQGSAQRAYVVRENMQKEDDELSEVSQATDITPINTDRSSRHGGSGLPDFGGHSPITIQAQIHKHTLPADFNENSPHDNMPNEHVPPHYGQASSSQAGQSQENSQFPVTGDYTKIYTATLDPDVSRMETVMDQWCLDLKRNVLAEFGQSKIRIVEQGRQHLISEQARHASEKTKMMEEMNSLKELLATYEKSIERKDQVISNLTQALQQQKENVKVMRSFCQWKMSHNDIKREKFCNVLADKHHKRCLKRKVWDAWHSAIENKWRVRIEKACQAKAQEVCMQLTDDYEAKLAMMRSELSTATVEIANMKLEKERYEEMMKKAFMRGVCALNLEAMSMFNEKETDSECSNSETNLQETYPQLPQRIVTSEGSRPLLNLQPTNKTITSQMKTTTTTVQSSRVQSAKAGTSKQIDPRKTNVKIPPTNRTGAPPKSVIVERHPPVNKETMPHAVAGKYGRGKPKPPNDKSNNAVNQGHINLHTVKHVE